MEDISDEGAALGRTGNNASPPKMRHRRRIDSSTLVPCFDQETLLSFEQALAGTTKKPRTYGAVHRDVLKLCLETLTGGAP
jgi:hypothetical protein